MAQSISQYKEGAVSGFLHEPESAVVGGIVLTHGAGTNCTSPLLVSIAEALCNEGMRVLRCDLPYRQKRRVGPPHPAGAAADRAGLGEAVRQLQTFTSQPTYLGGHSYGGRQASMLMTEADAPSVRAMLLLSYPLHPPRKPEQWRTEHFPRLQTPAFLFHGSRDPFGSPEEMAAALQLLPPETPRELLVVERAGHELLPKSPASASECAERFCAFLATLG